jgi:hypothetical protein
MKIYLTKSALRIGIREIETEGELYFYEVGKKCIDAYKRIDAPQQKNRVLLHTVATKPYWHLTREEAINHANEMKAKEIASLERKLNRIKNLKFE